ncbi:hypothetical protein MJD09_28295 [bacterium]|nr:hypothetical protein [bacterium]
MWQDPIVEEIHKIREEHAAEFDFDLEAIYNDLKQAEEKSAFQTVSLPVQRYQARKAEL